MIRLVAFLETDFGIRVEDEELTVENFETLRKLGELNCVQVKGCGGPTPIDAFAGRTLTINKGGHFISPFSLASG